MRWLGQIAVSMGGWVLRGALRPPRHSNHFNHPTCDCSFLFLVCVNLFDNCSKLWRKFSRLLSQVASLLSSPPPSILSRHPVSENMMALSWSYLHEFVYCITPVYIYVTIIIHKKKRFFKRLFLLTCLICYTHSPGREDRGCLSMYIVYTVLSRNLCTVYACTVHYTVCNHSSVVCILGHFLEELPLYTKTDTLTTYFHGRCLGKPMGRGIPLPRPLPPPFHLYTLKGTIYQHAYWDERLLLPLIKPGSQEQRLCTCQIF